MNIHLLLEMQNEDMKFSYETFNKIEFILKTKNKYLSTRYDNMFLLWIKHILLIPLADICF